MTTLQLTGSDEREKRKKRASTDRRGLHSGRGLTVCTVTVCTKTKIERGKWETTFPMPSYCPPFGYVALSHLARIPMLLHSFVLQLPSPSRCV